MPNYLCKLSNNIIKTSTIMARKNILKSGKYATSALVSLRAHFLKFTDELPEIARQQYRKNVCSLTPPRLYIPRTGPFMKDVKDRITHPRDALLRAFEWDQTPEGENFWLQVYRSLPSEWTRNDTTGVLSEKPH